MKWELEIELHRIVKLKTGFVKGQREPALCPRFNSAFWEGNKKSGAFKMGNQACPEN